MRWIALGILAATPVSAETITVRSGEHADFSRIVLSPAKSTPWELAKTEQGYRFTFARDSISFDFSRAFDLIPKDRILNIAAGDAPASIDFVLKPGVVAKGFEAAGGVVAIDFSTEEDVAEKAPEAKSVERLPLTSLASSEPISTPFYWRGIAPKLTSVEPPTQTSEAEVPPAFVAPKNDARIAAAETQLLEQLSRAASQGLVKVAVPQPKVAPKETSMPPTVEQVPQADSVPEAAKDKDPLAYQMQTAIDREMAQSPETLSYTGSGQECLLDSDLDFASWVNDEPPAVQIADARRKLVGEFDKASGRDVTDLAKLYLGLSFGAEAQSVLNAFNPETDEKETLLYLARVLDGLPIDQSSPILGMVECESAAAMWALLGAQTVQSNRQINFSAIQRAYAALPHALRLAVADPLIEKLILNDAQDIARMIRKSAARIEPEGDTLKMSDARLDLAEGETAKAEIGLKNVVAQDGQNAVEALLMLVETQFENGDITDAKTVENVAALAFEHRFADDGAKLARALVLAATAARQYDRAIHELDNWPVDKNGVKSNVAQQVYEHIVDDADDIAFLKASLDSAPLWDAKNAELEVKIRASERYMDLGFPAQVIELLSGEQEEDDVVAMLVARAHLLLGDGAQAIAAVQRLTSREAEKIRAEALALLEQPEASASAYITSGDPENARRQAWQAGAWDVTSQVGSSEEKAALESLALMTNSADQTSPSDPATEEIGPIGQSQKLIDDSARMRAALEALLASQQ